MKTIKFYSGDLLNGDIHSFDTYEEAHRDYVSMAEGCAQTDRGDETVSREQAVEESLAFHYVRKETIERDVDGHIIREDSETLDGGDAEACGYTG
jgi:hypothetical protein